MIVVIADDITGAAEIGGVARRFNLSNMIVRDLNSCLPKEKEVVIYDTNSREKETAESIQSIKALKRLIKNTPVSKLFKKTDSVCRGNITDELCALMTLKNAKKTLFTPASPSTNRVVREGHLFLNSKPIHKSHFKKDPTFPAQSSCVVDILGYHSDSKIISCKINKVKTFTEGIIVSDVENETDLLNLTKMIEPETLAAGSAAFFEQWLSGKHKIPKSPVNASNPSLPMPWLIIIGSRHDINQKQLEELKKNEHCLVEIDALNNENLKATDTNAIVNSANYIVVIKTGDIANKDICSKLAKLTYKLHNSIKPKTLIISGGETAENIFDTFGWHTVEVSHEIEQGVVVLDTKTKTRITLKPGSYGRKSFYLDILRRGFNSQVQQVMF